MPRLHVITASTRPTRKGPAVTKWFLPIAESHGGFEIEPVDLAEVALPLLDEPEHPSRQEYRHEHTKAWSRTIARADAFVVVLPEYDNGPPAALVNALQFLSKEWAYKPMAFVSYGGVSGGTRSAAVVKMTAVVLRMMPIPEAVSIPFFSRHLGDDGAFDPGEVQAKAATRMLDELLRWAEALAPMREG